MLISGCVFRQLIHSGWLFCRCDKRVLVEGNDSVAEDGDAIFGKKKTSIFTSSD